MTAETCVTDEVDSGIEKAREELRERIKKIREEKKEEEKKAEEKRQEDETSEKLQLDKNIKLRYDSGIVIAGNMMRRDGFDQKM